MPRMTKEEAIDIFEDNFTVLNTHGYYTEAEEAEAITMAIKALEQEPNCSEIPTGSTANIECDNTDCNNCVNHKYCDYEKFDAVMDNMLKHPSTTKNDLGVDCIVDVLGSYTDLDIPYKREIAENILTRLSSVTPQEPETGHWIDVDGDNAVCGCCNRLNHVYGIYCKHCGAKMVEP